MRRSVDKNNSRTLYRKMELRHLARVIFSPGIAFISFANSNVSTRTSAPLFFFAWPHSLSLVLVQISLVSAQVEESSRRISYRVFPRSRVNAIKFYGRKDCRRLGGDTWISDDYHFPLRHALTLLSSLAAKLGARGFALEFGVSLAPARGTLDQLFTSLVVVERVLFLRRREHGVSPMFPEFTYAS